jgi:uncharacterized membrane protein
MSDGTETWLGLRRRVKPLVVAGILLGVGLGGFFDGIVLHQILQWHHMLSSHPDPGVANDLALNTVADGFFHAATYLFTIAGIAALWRAWRAPDVPRSTRALLGSVVLGWGLFNVVEGVLNHQLLGIHHVWPAGPGPVVLWDAAFLLWGLVFVGGGYAVVRSADAASGTREGAVAGRTDTESAD